MLLRLCFVMINFALVACATTKGADDLPNEFPKSLNQATSFSTGGSLGALDVISIKVYGAEELDGDYQIGFDGKLKLPLIEEFQASRITPLQLEAMLKSEYEASYFQRADVSVIIKEKKEQHITVDGSVKSPGQYTVKGNATLMSAIALSGGTDEFANLKRVAVFRQIEGTRHVAGYNLADIRDGLAPDPEIFPSDLIIVDGSNLRRNYRDLIRAVPLLVLFNR